MQDKIYKNWVLDRILTGQKGMEERYSTSNPQHNGLRRMFSEDDGDDYVLTCWLPFMYLLASVSRSRMCSRVVRVSMLSQSALWMFTLKKQRQMKSFNNI